ncbi:MAG TPA: hypothetical protein VJU61_20810, partial [Polyangiaceae bacterium]|nr:hypothetical protein [Polyangiaceae bacterium]
PQFESVGSPTLDGQQNNLYLRRTRFIFGMTAFKNLDVFFDTEFANLFKAGAADGIKATPVGVNVLDAFLTYKVVGDLFKVDAGYLLPPLSHNALQSAGTLYSWDYFDNSFRHSNVFGTSANPTGRDLGLQLRGLVVDGLLEYRVAMLQGLREPPVMGGTEVGSQNMFRLGARLQLNLLDPETGFAYWGSYLGTKKILSFGVAYDFQDSYKYFAIDGFLDLPLGPGVLTAQVDVVQMDGDDWVALPKQTAIMGEAGFTFASLRLSPILRFEMRKMDTNDAANPDETRIGGGLAYWAHSHSFNVKAFFTHVDPDPAAHAYNQINVQTQVFLF